MSIWFDFFLVPTVGYGPQIDQSQGDNSLKVAP